MNLENSPTKSAPEETAVTKKYDGRSVLLWKLLDVRWEGEATGGLVHPVAAGMALTEWFVPGFGNRSASTESWKRYTKKGWVSWAQNGFMRMPVLTESGFEDYLKYRLRFDGGKL